MTDAQPISVTKGYDTSTGTPSFLRRHTVHVFLCVVLLSASACGSQTDETAQSGDGKSTASSDTTQGTGSPQQAPAETNGSPAQRPPERPADEPSITTAPPATGSPPPTAPPPEASGPMNLRPPATGSYVYVRESGGDTDQRTEEYKQEEKGDDYVLMYRQFQFADVTLLSVEAWADSRAKSPGVYWIQARVPGISSDWCEWPADNRPKLLPGDLSKSQTLTVNSTCTVKPGETMSVKGVVEVKGGSNDRARVDTKLTVSYQGPARTGTRQVEGTALISPSRGLVTEASGSYSGTGLRRTDFKDRLKR